MIGDVYDVEAAEDAIAGSGREDDPATRLDRLFGAGVDWQSAKGILHVAAIGARPRAAIAVGASAPHSPTDRFVLGFARARADAVVTTGAILRAEPHLVHRTSETPREEAAWTRWRAEVLRRRTTPILLVLTGSGEVDVAHPALAASPRPIVWTTKAGWARIGAGTGRIDIVVDGVRDGSPANDRAEASSALSAAIRWLRDSAGAETVVIEAGPRSTQGIYAVGSKEERGIVAIDELLLSIYGGGSFPAVPGSELPESETLAAYFSSAGPRTRTRVEEASGPWLFERYRRA